MKRFLMMMAAMLAFAACNKDEGPDYDRWTTEELLATGGGIDYLVKKGGPIDYEQIGEWLGSHVFSPAEEYVYDGGWTLPDLLGASTGCLIVLDASTYRRCWLDTTGGYLTPDGKWTKHLYLDISYTGDPLRALLDTRFGPDAKIAAQVGKTLIVAYEDVYKRRWRAVVHLTDDREQALAFYPDNLLDCRR